MDWFGHCRSVAEIKAEFRRLCFMYHPDRGGDGELMQSINRSYRLALQATADRQASVPSRPATPPRTWHRPPAPTVPRRDYTREEVRQQWDNATWQQLTPGQHRRQVGCHVITIVQFVADRVPMWAVQVDSRFSSYAFQSRSEAEEEGFQMVYDQVQCLGL